MNRLTSVTEPDGTKEEYTFDGQGNIQTKTMTHPEGYEYTFKQNGKEYTLNDVATHEITYSYDANNRLKFEVEYIGGSGEEYEGFLEVTRYSEYDNNGNMIKRTRGEQVDEETESYEYNELNQLTKYTNPNGEETTYKYNPDGMRTSKINNGVETKYYWDRGYISAESVNDEYTASNYIGTNGIFARDEAENTDYMLKNGHGDVTSLVSEGVKDKTYDYSAYGEEKWKIEGDTNPFRYSGEYVDEESGLIYLRNRYYDPSIGRFITEDPYWNIDNMTSSIDAIKQSNNLYSYAMGNPIMYVDSSGMIAYEHFSDLESALKDWAWNYYGTTDYIMYEFASTVYWDYDEQGKEYYSYTWASFGTPHSVDASESSAWMPEGATRLGVIHSHPNSEDFSRPDKEWSIYNKAKIFLVTPSGTIKEYYHRNYKEGEDVETVIATNVPFAKLSEERKKELERRFYNAWYDHTHPSCKFNCQNKV